MLEFTMENLTFLDRKRATGAGQTDPRRSPRALLGTYGHSTHTLNNKTNRHVHFTIY